MNSAGAMWPDHAVLVRTPATSANLGPGFDALGLALCLHDEVRVQVIDSGLRIEVSGVGEPTAGHGESHLVVRAMRAAFDILGGQPPGLSLSCQNTIPHGFGLGSSAAAIVAGVLAARALSGESGAARLPDQSVLQLATDIEGHADNVAACLAGGLTIAWSAGSVRCLRLDPAPGLSPVLCVPTLPLATEAARKVLPATVPHADAARNAARSALLVAALTRPVTDAGLLLDATLDFLHQPYRADSMPGTAELVAELRKAGIPAVVSGAGPAVLALVVPGVTAEPEAVAGIAADTGNDWSVRNLEVDRDGAVVRHVAPGRA
jgi:homoserine kinase